MRDETVPSFPAVESAIAEGSGGLVASQSLYHSVKRDTGSINTFHNKQ